MVLLLVIGFICSITTLKAQRPTGPPSGTRGQAAQKTGYGKFSGIVKDAQGDLVPYATIKLLSGEDKKLVNGAIADDDGRWVIRNVPEGDFHVSITNGSTTVEAVPITVSTISAPNAIVLANRPRFIGLV